MRHAAATPLFFSPPCPALTAPTIPSHHHRPQEFKSLKNFTAFNTNNLWVSLKSIKELVSVDAIQSPVIVNERVMGGAHVLELETAAGAAIEVRGRGRARVRMRR